MASERKLRVLLRIALDKMAQNFACCAFSPHFNNCKTIALIDDIRKQARLRRWPGYLKGMVRADHPVRR